MRNRRLSNPVSPDPSIEPLSHSGRGTRERANNDLGLDAGNTMSVKKTVRGMTEVAPAVRVQPDFVAGAKRMHVAARSGNDSRLLDRPGIPGDGMWDSVGMGDTPAPAQSGTMQKLLLAGVLFGGLWYLAKGGRH